MFKVATLYKFVSLRDVVALQQLLQEICKDKELVGTLLLAPEGMNGTIAGIPDKLEEVIDSIQAIPAFHDLFYQYAETATKPFRRLKIRVKKEIITMAKAQTAPIVPRGHHVSAVDWNALLDKVTLVVDVRNKYEYRVGTFEGAVNPNTACFSEFPSFVDKTLAAFRDRPVALFCTGGIRCEKASAYMLERGFQEVYQLKGGILQYLTHVSEAETKWQGECFVFDRRIALGHGLKKGRCLLCYGCRMPLTEADLDKNYKPGDHCKYCLAQK